jgi:hypothetical protein
MNLLPDAAPHEQNADASYLKKWFDNQDLLLLLNVTDRTLRNWRKKGYLPFERFGPRTKILYDGDAIKAALSEGKIWKGKK